MHKMDWNDLQYVLAVAAAGSAAGAARRLNVNHSTVIRRIKAFETRHKVRVFDHLATGYRLTPQGEIFFEAAQAIETTLSELDRKIVGGHGDLQGNVRITTTDGIAPFLTDDFAGLRRSFPTITLDVLVTNRTLNLDRLDAEIAIRASHDPPDQLMGRRVCGLGFAVYGTPAFSAGGPQSDIRAQDWLGMEEPIINSRAGRWVGENIPRENIVVRSDSFITMRDLAALNMGLTLLPCHLGDNDPRLRRISAVIDEIDSGLWLLSHRDVLRSQRIRSCTDFLYASLRRKKELFEGTAAARVSVICKV